MTTRRVALYSVPLLLALAGCSSSSSSHSLPDPPMPPNSNVTSGHGTVGLTNDDAKGPSEVGVSCKGKGVMTLLNDTNINPIAKIDCAGGRTTTVKSSSAITRLFVNAPDTIDWRIALGDQTK